MIPLSPAAMSPPSTCLACAPARGAAPGGAHPYSDSAGVTPSASSPTRAVACVVLAYPDRAAALPLPRRAATLRDRRGPAGPGGDARGRSAPWHAGCPHVGHV